MFCKNCGAEINENAAVCMNCGFAKGTGDKFCSVCGKVFVEQVIIPIKHEVVTVKGYEATCTENGLERMDCSRCDYHEDRVIEAKGHLYYKYSFRCNHIPTTDLEDKYINSLDKIHYCYYCTHTLVETGVSDETIDKIKNRLCGG